MKKEENNQLKALEYLRNHNISVCTVFICTTIDGDFDYAEYKNKYGFIFNRGDNTIVIEHNCYLDRFTGTDKDIEDELHLIFLNYNYYRDCDFKTYCKYNMEYDYDFINKLVRYQVILSNSIKLEKILTKSEIKELTDILNADDGKISDSCDIDIIGYLNELGISIQIHHVIDEKYIIALHKDNKTECFDYIYNDYNYSPDVRYNIALDENDNTDICDIMRDLLLVDDYYNYGDYTYQEFLDLFKKEQLDKYGYDIPDEEQFIKKHNHSKKLFNVISFNDMRNIKTFMYGNDEF